MLAVGPHGRITGKSLKRALAMKKLVCATALAVVLASSTALVYPHESAHAQALDDELNVLLKTHPQLKAARQNVAAAEEGVNRAFSEYLPNVRAFADMGYERIDQAARRSAGQDAFTTGTARSTSVTITQTLFNGYRNEADNDTAHLTKGVAEIELVKNTQTVLFEAVSTYMEVLRNGRLIALSTDQEATIKRQLELEDERVRRGSGIAVDVLQSKSRLQVARERRVAFQGALQDSVSRYIQVFGHEPQKPAMVMPPPPLSLLPESLEAGNEIALSEHPDVINADTRVDLADQTRRLAKSDFYPTVDLVGEWSYEDDLNAVRGTRRDYKAKVQASWELFNGFGTRAAVAESSHQFLSSIDTSNFVQRKVVEELRLAWFGLETARERVRLLQNAVNIAGEVFDARRKLREAGKETVINVLDAENELFNARINLVAAQHDARIAVYRVLLAMGRLTHDNVSGVAALEPLPEKFIASISEGDTAPVTIEPTSDPAAPAADIAPDAAPLATSTSGARADEQPVEPAPQAVRTSRVPEAAPVEIPIVDLPDTEISIPDAAIPQEVASSEMPPVEILAVESPAAEVAITEAAPEPTATPVVKKATTEVTAPVETAPSDVLDAAALRDQSTVSALVEHRAAESVALKMATPPATAEEAVVDAPQAAETTPRIVKASLSADEEANFNRVWPYDE